jgi:hypothetical protein
MATVPIVKDGTMTIPRTAPPIRVRRGFGVSGWSGVPYGDRTT